MSIRRDGRTTGSEAARAHPGAPGDHGDPFGGVPAFCLEGRVAVVTGAVGLLGRQHCIALAHAGANVVVTDVDHGACEDVAAIVSSAGAPQAIAVAADITKPNDLHVLRDRVFERFGRLDVLVNNAAVNDKVEGAEGRRLVPFEHFPLDQWKRSVDVNLTGTFLCSQILGGAMAERRRGSIINIASTYGLVAPDQRIYRDAEGNQLCYKSPVYSATKAAVLGLTKYLAAYWGASGVRVNAVSPGGVKTIQHSTFVENYAERTMLGRMANPEDYRGVIVFLASDSSNYVTGANVVVDGGWTAW